MNNNNISSSQNQPRTPQTPVKKIAEKPSSYYIERRFVMRTVSCDAPLNVDLKE